MLSQLISTLVAYIRNLASVSGRRADSRNRWRRPRTCCQEEQKRKRQLEKKETREAMTGGRDRKGGAYRVDMGLVLDSLLQGTASEVRVRDDKNKEIEL
jgi:hypothetical protein